MFTDRRYQEAVGFLIILFSIIILLSLLSFNINDFELLANNESVHNIMGPLGSYFSDFLRSAFGYSSYIVFFIFGIAGWGILKNRSITDVMERILSLFFLMITSSIMLSLLYKTDAAHFSGGYIGLYLSRLSVSLFSKTGSFLIIIILNLIGFVLLGIVSLSSLIKYTKYGSGGISILTKKVFRKMFIYQLSEKIPLNSIHDVIEKRYRRIPWIIKRKIIIGDGSDLNKPLEEDHPKLIELKEDNSKQGNAYPAEEETTIPFESMSTIDTNFTSETDLFNQDINENMFIRPNDRDSLDTEDFPPSYIEDKIVCDPIQGMYEEDDHSVDSSQNGIDGIEINRIKTVEVDEDKKPNVLVKEASKLNDGDRFDLGNIDIESDGGEEKHDCYDDRDPLDMPRVFNRIHINKEYIIPTSFLDFSSSIDIDSWKSEAMRTSEQLVKTLREFGIESRVINVNRGPVITLYEMQIGPGIKVTKIVGLSDDIAMALAVYRVRIVAPIPGKSAIGVEVPNRDRELVTLGDIIASNEYQSQFGRLKVGLGKDILGKPITLDIKKLPHLLIAGATGSGKSVCVNSIITSIAYNYDPNYVRFILIDPKMVELQLYNGIPHLITPVITESYVAPKALKWAMYEMERRYRLLSELNTRYIEKYNEKIVKYGDRYERLPYIVIIIDELSDLMMIASKEIEGFITRIAQKARAVGIHLVLATQRPSVDIITGVIKANFPARIAFQVAQKTDSRTIIDQNGAEKLLGKGDMLYQSPVSSFPIRIQGAFISEEEIMKIVRHLRSLGKPSYIDIEDSIFDDEEDLEDIDEAIEDELFVEALKIVDETKKASASYLQRRLSIGYNRAARIIEMMEDRGYIGPQQGSKPREVYL